MAVIKITEVTSKPCTFESINKFAEMAGITYQGVTGLFKPDPRTGESVLDMCYPVPNSKSKEDEFTGPKCVAMNKKATDYIKLKKDKEKKSKK